VFHRNAPNDPANDDSLPRPCPQMKGLLSSLSDGTLGGIARWYAENHVKGCPHCSATLSSLRTLRDRLRALGVPALPEEATEFEKPVTDLLPAERRLALEAALAEMDSSAG